MQIQTDLAELPNGEFAEIPESLAPDKIEEHLREHFPHLYPSEKPGGNTFLQNLNKNVSNFYGNTNFGFDPKKAPNSEYVDTLTKAAFAGLNAPSSTYQGVKSAADYLTPSKEATQFFEKIVGKNAKELTHEENAGQLVKRVKMGYKANKEDALQSLRKAQDLVGEKDIYGGYPKGFEEYAPKNYKPEHEANGYYKSAEILEPHQEFVENPTFNNAYQLRKRLNARIGKLQNLVNEGKDIGLSGGEELGALVKRRNQLDSDINNFFNKNPEAKGHYDLFNTKWRENVSPYTSSTLLSSISKNPNFKGLTQSDIRGIFSNPTNEASKILGDIGEAGRGNVLFNEIQKINPKVAGDLAEKLLELRKTGGYQETISPEMKGLADNLAARSLWRERAAKGALTAGGAGLGELFGGPFGALVGGAIGAGAKPTLNKLMELLGKRA